VRRLLAAEWLKLRSVPSTWYMLGVAALGVGVSALVAFYAASAWNGATAAMRRTMRVTPLPPVAGLIADLALAVLGILAFTDEQNSGLLGLSLAAVPRRGAFLAAKAMVVGAVALIAGEAVSFATFFAGRAIVGGRAILYLTIPFRQEWPLLISLGLCVLLFALVGLGLGVILRSTAGAIIVLVAGFLYILPLVALHIPPPWGYRVSSVLLANLGPELARAPQSWGFPRTVLSPLWTGAVMALYVAVALGAALVLIRRRDA